MLGQVAMTLAKRPMPSARQSKNICMAAAINRSISRGLEAVSESEERALTIRDQPQTICPDAVRHLDKHEGEVEAQEEVNPPRLRRGEDDLDRRARVAVDRAALGEEGRVGSARASRDTPRRDDGSPRVCRDYVAGYCIPGGPSAMRQKVQPLEWAHPVHLASRRPPMRIPPTLSAARNQELQS